MSAIEEKQFEAPGLIMTETPMNTGDSGPYFVYSPGFTFEGLKPMVFHFNVIPANNAFKLTSGDQWAMPQMFPDGAAAKKRSVKHPYTGQVIEEHHARTIPAQDTLNALLSDRSLTSFGLTQIAIFDKIDAFESVFNSMIERELVEVSCYPENKQWEKIVRQTGMLEMRKIWLETTLEELETGRVLTDVGRVLDGKPYLLDVWKVAIKKTLLPSLNAFKVIANTRLAAVEERIRSGKQVEYDPYSHTLMWLLGRQPERTALSRTLEGANKTNQTSGITPDQIRALVQETFAANRPEQPTLIDKRQCGNCGEYVNAVAGGFPRKCRFCGFEFQQVLNSSEPELSFDSSDDVKPSLVDDRAIEDLADRIMNS